MTYIFFREGAFYPFDLKTDEEAIANAKNQHYTGKDFRDAKSK